jgi:hypothetical protein
MIKEFFKEIKKGQKNFGEDIQSVINFFMLTLVYFVGIGLTSIFGKIFNKHFLDLKIFKDAKTYWEDFDQKDKTLEEYYRQF